MEKCITYMFRCRSHLVFLWIGLLFVILCPDFSVSNHLTSVTRSSSRQNLGITSQRRSGNSRINNQRLTPRSNIRLTNQSGRRRTSTNCIPGTICRTQVTSQTLRQLALRNQRRLQSASRRRGTNQQSSTSSRTQPRFSFRGRSGSADRELRLGGQSIFSGRTRQRTNSQQNALPNARIQSPPSQTQNKVARVGSSTRSRQSHPLQTQSRNARVGSPTRSGLNALETISNVLPRTLGNLINTLRSNGGSSIGVGIGISSSGRSALKSDASSRDNTQREVPNDTNRLNLRQSMDRIRQSFIKARSEKATNRKSPVTIPQNQASGPVVQVPAPKPLVPPPLARDQPPSSKSDQLVLQAPALDRGQLLIDQNTGKFTQQGGVENIFIDPTNNQNVNMNGLNTAGVGNSQFAQDQGNSQFVQDKGNSQFQDQNNIVRNLNNQGLNMNTVNSINPVQFPTGQSPLVQSSAQLTGSQTGTFGSQLLQFQPSVANFPLGPIPANAGSLGNNMMNAQSNIIGVLASGQANNVPAFVQNNQLSGESQVSGNQNFNTIVQSMPSSQNDLGSQGQIIGLQSNVVPSTRQVDLNQQNALSSQNMFTNGQIQNQNLFVNNQLLGTNNLVDVSGGQVISNNQNNMLPIANNNDVFQTQSQLQTQMNMQNQLVNNIILAQGQGQSLGTNTPQIVNTNIQNKQEPNRLSFGNSQVQNQFQMMNTQGFNNNNIQGQGQTPEIAFPAQPSVIVGQGPITVGMSGSSSSQGNNNLQSLGSIKTMQDIPTLLPNAQFAPMSTPNPLSKTTPKRIVIAIDPKSKGIEIVPDGKGGIKVIHLRHAITATPWNESVTTTPTMNTQPEVSNLGPRTTPHPEIQHIKDPELLRKLEATDRVNTTDIPEEREVNGQSLDGTYHNPVWPSNYQVTTSVPEPANTIHVPVIVQQANTNNLVPQTENQQANTNNLGPPTANQQTNTNNLGSQTGNQQANTNNLGPQTANQQISANNLGPQTANEQTSANSLGPKTTPHPEIQYIKDPELLRKLEATDRVNTTDIPEELEINGQSFDGTYHNPVFPSNYKGTTSLPKPAYSNNSPVVNTNNNNLGPRTTSQKTNTKNLGPKSTPHPEIQYIKDPELLRKLEATDRVNTTDIPEELEINGVSYDGTYHNPIFPSDHNHNHNSINTANSAEVGASTVPPSEEAEVEVEEEMTTTEVTTTERITTTTTLPPTTTTTTPPIRTVSPDIVSNKLTSSRTSGPPRLAHPMVKRTRFNMNRMNKPVEPNKTNLKPYLIKVLRNSVKGRPGFELKIITLPRIVG